MWSRKIYPCGVLRIRISQYALRHLWRRQKFHRAFRGGYSGHAEREERVVTRPIFSQKGYYFDTQIPNSGPFPPKVGRETTFVVTWSLVNNFNDIDGVSVRATLPGYIRWVGALVPANAAITFDPATRELTWSPGTILAVPVLYAPLARLNFRSDLRRLSPRLASFPSLSRMRCFALMITFADRDFTITEAIGDNRH